MFSLYDRLNSLIPDALNRIFSYLWAIGNAYNVAKYDEYHEKIWPQVSGNVLELGPGYGDNLRFLRHITLKDGSVVVDPSFISSYTALEPNPFMFSKIHKNAKLNGFNVSYDLTSYPAGTYSDTKASKEGQVPLKIVRGSLDTLDNIPQAVLDNAPYDSIMTSFSLCTAKDPESSLKNIFKLLKPGGTYHFIDHVRHPKQGDPFVVEGSGVNAWIWGKIQDWLTPLWKVIAHGCHLNRRTGETIVSMRCWKDTECKTIRRSGDLVALIMPLTMGKAVKPDDSE